MSAIERRYVTAIFGGQRRQYGDVVPVERWRLLGPLTAMNGVLLFGWSTAVIFEVLRRTLALQQR
jgi:Ion channel